MILKNIQVCSEVAVCFHCTTLQFVNGSLNESLLHIPVMLLSLCLTSPLQQCSFSAQQQMHCSPSRLCPPSTACPVHLPFSFSLAVSDTSMDEAAVELTLVQTLAVSTSKGRYLTLSPSFQRCSLASWIKDNIKKKECCFYVEEGRYEQDFKWACLIRFTLSYWGINPWKSTVSYLIWSTWSNFGEKRHNLLHAYYKIV